MVNREKHPQGHNILAVGDKISYPDAGIPYGDPVVPVEEDVVGVGIVEKGVPVNGGFVVKGIAVPVPVAVADDG